MVFPFRISCLIAVMWIRMRLDPHSFGSGSRGVKWRERQSLTNKFWGVFLKEIIFLRSVPKKSSLSLRFRYRFKNICFSWLLKDGLKSIWWFIVPDPDSSNYVDPDPPAINADPHHCLIVPTNLEVNRYPWWNMKYSVTFLNKLFFGRRVWINKSQTSVWRHGAWKNIRNSRKY